MRPAIANEMKSLPIICHHAGIRERAGRRSLLWPIIVDFQFLISAFNCDFLSQVIYIYVEKFTCRKEMEN